MTPAEEPRARNNPDPGRAIRTAEAKLRAGTELALHYPVAALSERASERTRPLIGDRELTQLQTEGTVVLRHSMIDGLRLTAILGALNVLGIEPSDVVLHATAADCIAVTVKRAAGGVRG